MIANCWGRAPTVKVDGEEQIIQSAEQGRSYHHHAHVLAAGGRLFATFSSGTRNEDDIGQCVLFTTSDDRGRTWSPPRTAALPPAGQFATCVQTATGLYAASRDESGRPNRFDGMHKGGRYGYPYLAVCDDTVVVLYSINKEDMAVTRFPLAALD